MKRILSTLSLFAIIAASLVGIAPVASAAAPIVGIGTVHAGMYSSEWEAAADLGAMEAWAGKQITFAGTFHDVNESHCGGCWKGNTAWTLEQAWIGGSTPVVNLNISASAYAIAHGDWDSRILQWAADVKNWVDYSLPYGDGGAGAGLPQRRLFIAPLQEQNGDWVPYGCDPANFKLAYARIRSLVQSVGLDETRARWIWAPNGWTSTVGACAGKTLADYYPGSTIVDAVGYSAYRWGDGASVYQAVAGVADQLRAIDSTKPYLVLQTATWKGLSDNNQWIRDLFTWAAGDPNVVGVVWFNFDRTNQSQTDWRAWNSSSQSGILSGWKDALSQTSTIYTWPLTDWFQPGALPFSPVPTGQLSDRAAGSNRYTTAVAISADTFAPGVPVAYVATGLAFPDALAAAAAAGAQGGPVLLVPGTSVGSDTLAELRRLDPGRIVVVGGVSAVSDDVVQALQGIAPTDRIGGTNRYDTAARIATDAFGSGVPIAYVATGRDFPDALAAAAAAGAQGGPVLLTDPWGLPGPTAQAIATLQPRKIIVVGGVSAVSDTVFDALAALQPDIQRIAGSNRYDTAARLAAFNDSPDTVFVATGIGFPDALAGAAAAGYLGVPLLLTLPTSVPGPTSAKLSAFTPNPNRVVVLGGISVISDYVSWQLWLAAG